MDFRGGIYRKKKQCKQKKKLSWCRETVNFQWSKVRYLLGKMNAYTCGLKQAKDGELIRPRTHCIKPHEKYEFASPIT